MSAAVSRTPQSPWLVAGGCAVLLTAAILGLFWPTTVSMVRVWANSETFTHCFFIPLITLWLIWRKREALAGVAPGISYLGLAALAGAAFLWLLGSVASVQVVQHLALVLMVQAGLLAVWGSPAMRVVFFPVAYLLFAVPAGEFLTAHLQDFTAHFVVQSLRIIGVPVFSDGVFISIPTGNFEVAEACSGIRFLIATLAVGTLFAYLSYRSAFRRFLFLCLAVIVPVIANGFRALFIVLLAYYTNNRLAVGVDHIIYGWGFFAAVLLLLLFIGSKFADRPVDEEVPPRGDGPGRSAVTSWSTATVTVAALLIVSAAPAYARYIAVRGDHLSVATALPATLSGQWQAMATGANPLDWHPVFAGADRTAQRSYRNGEQTVTLYAALYLGQSQGAELINNANSIVGPRPWQRAGSGRRELPGVPPAAYIRMTTLRDSAIIYRWYWVDDQFTASPVKAKLLYTKAALLGGNLASGVVALAVPRPVSDADTERTAADFLKSLAPLSGLFRTAPSKE